MQRSIASQKEAWRGINRGIVGGHLGTIMIMGPEALARVNTEIHVKGEQSKSNQIISIHKMDDGLHCKYISVLNFPLTEFFDTLVL